MHIKPEDVVGPAKQAAINRYSQIEQRIRTVHIVTSLLKVYHASPALAALLRRSEEGSRLIQHIARAQPYVWRRVGLAEYLYPEFADIRKVEPVAFVTQDTDYAPINKKDLRFTWRIFGRAGTDNNGWAKTITAAKAECEQFINKSLQ